MAFLPNLIPNPNYRWGDDENPSGPPRGGTVDEVLFAHDKWRVGHEHGVDDHDVIYRSFRCRDAKTGHALLESLQDALYSDNERGCRIRRETQGMFYMCCDGVRVRLNEPKHEVLVEVPMPAETNAQLAECRKTLGTVETVAKKHHSR